MTRAIALLVALFAASPALAYRFSDTCGSQVTRWAPGSPNTLWRYSTAYASADVSQSTARATLQAAFDEWSNPGCSEFDAAEGTTTTSDPGGTSSQHIVGFYESGWPGQWGSSTLAITLTSYSPSSCLISGSDMVFNGDDWDFTTSGSNFDVDLQAVATHEAGHWLGLDHSTHPGSSLWPSWSGGTDERTLTCDDSTAVCRSHPSGSNSCTADRFCACGTGCSNGTCGGTVPVDPGPGECSGNPASQSESEPNDWVGEQDVDWFQPSGGGDFTINGSITCGNNGEQYTADSDWYVIDFPCSDEARFTLDWSGNSDLDFYVWDTSSNTPFAANNDAGNSGPATDEAEAGGRIYVQVACWTGSSTSYTFKVDWAPFAGTTEPVDPCGGLTWEGECQGDVAVWCQDDEIQQYDCSNEGGCGLTQEYGYFCLGSDDTDSTPDTDGTDTDEDTDELLPWIPGCGACSTGGPAGLGGLVPALAAAAAIRRRRARRT